jgi:protein TonB
MAYADQGMSKGKMIGLGVAVFVHILLGYAFVTGLALKAVKTIVGPLETVNIKAETPPPDEPPPPPKDVEIPPFVPPPEVTVQSDAPPPPTMTIQNYAPPPPAPVFHEPPAAPAAPKGPTSPAIAIGHSQEVSEDDYPPASLRAEEQGRTVITVSINAQGRVDTCSVQASSGFPKLDEKSCQIAQRRFRYKPALQDGTPVATSKVVPIKWQITSK